MSNKIKESEGGNGLVSDVFVTENDDWLGDDGNDDGEEYYKDGEIASCIDVLGFCFKRSFNNWMSLVLHCTLFTALVYCYFYGIVLLGSAAEVLAGCQAGSLLELTANPITCVLVGVLTTCIWQSSTVTVFVIGSLVGNVLTIQQGIYMALGANVGNTIMNSLIVLVHSLNKSELERAVAGASVNDFYYFYALLIFLPLEACTGLLYHLSAALVPETLSEGYFWSGFIGNLIKPYTDLIIMVNKGLINNIASGSIESCEAMYPVFCENNTKSYESCVTGILSCSAETGICPFLFKASVTFSGDFSAGIIACVIAIVIILLSMLLMIKLVRKMLVETPVEVIASITGVNSYVTMVVGCLSSMLLGSSSLTESALNPFLACGVIELEQMYPFSLGSNIGMAGVTLFQALSSGNTGFFHVALANTFFNVLGVFIWYPIPFMRKFPLHSSLILGVVTRRWRVFSLVHILFSFFGVPFILLGINALITSGNTGMKAVGIILLIIIGLVIVPSLIWWFYGSGKERFIRFFEDASGNNFDDDYREDEEEMSFPESISEGTSVGGGSSVGGYEVKYKSYKPKGKSSPKGILKNQKPRTLSDLNGENSLTNMKPKPPPPQSRKRLKKTRTRQPIQTNQCCTEVTACGLGS